MDGREILISVPSMIQMALENRSFYFIFKSSISMSDGQEINGVSAI
jgi:hypothetical protein